MVDTFRQECIEEHSAGNWEGWKGVNISTYNLRDSNSAEELALVFVMWWWLSSVKALARAERREHLSESLKLWPMQKNRMGFRQLLKKAKLYDKRRPINNE